jgi:hypothetical protein
MPAAFGLIKGLDRSKVRGMKLTEWVIDSHVKKTYARAARQTGGGNHLITYL